MLSGTPRPALYSVPEPQPSEICIAIPNTKAPINRLTEGGPSAACVSGKCASSGIDSSDSAASRMIWPYTPDGSRCSTRWRQPVVKPKRAAASAQPSPTPTSSSSACRADTDHSSQPNSARMASASGQRCAHGRRAAPGAPAGRVASVLIAS